MSYKTSWNLGLLYKSADDPAIERDMKAIERACASFAKKYKGKKFTASPAALSKAIKDYEKLIELLAERKPWRYFSLQTQLNSDDAKAGALSTKYDQRITRAVNEIQFFLLDLGKIPSAKQKSLLKNKTLAAYHYFLDRVFIRAKHNLSEAEEQLESLMAQTSYTMWVDANERLLNQQTIEFKGAQLPISQASAMLPELPTAERREIHNKLNQAWKSVAHMSEAEINAVYNFKKISDERHKYPKPYSSTIMSNENNEKSVLNLVKLVTDNFGIAERFYKLHAKLLGLDQSGAKLSLADRGAKIGEIKKKLDFETGVAMFRKALDRFDPEYRAILDDYLEKGQIDVYPKKGKHAGAFCAGAGLGPTYVLLNQVDDIRSLQTLAHEMGHAFHTELRKKQPPLYRDYSTSTAEVASTFFENIINEEIEKILGESERKTFKHLRLMDDINTIFRQVAFFNAELDLHKRVRAEGQLAKGDIADLMSKHLRSYLGPAFDITHDDGYFYVYLTHIRYFFYVYTYAFGQIVSRGLYARYKADPSFKAGIKKFLEAGSSATPDDIFKSIGLNISKPAFFELGLKAVEKEIEELEKMV